MDQTHNRGTSVNGDLEEFDLEEFDPVCPTCHMPWAKAERFLDRLHKAEARIAEVEAKAEHAFTEGVLTARRKYAQAWADATGTEVNEVEFTTEFIAQVARERDEIRTEIEELKKEIGW